MARRTAQSRNMTNRDAEAREAPAVTHRKKLDVPAEIKAAEAKRGFGIRWIAMSVHNQPLDNNVEARLMNGWAPIAASDYPKMVVQITLPGREAPTIIRRGGQMLCRKPQVDIDADREAVTRETMEDLQSVNWAERDNANKQLGARVVDANDLKIERVTSKSNAAFKE
jgi:hypothetical protein